MLKTNNERSIASNVGRFLFLAGVYLPRNHPKSVITRHIGNIYSEGELLRESTSAKIAVFHELFP